MVVTPGSARDRPGPRCDEVAVVGVGETGYGEDYQRLREAERAGTVTACGPGEVDEAGYLLLIAAFKSALADSGLSKHDIDGLAMATMPTPSPTNYERVGELLGLTVTWGGETGPGDHLIQLAVEAIRAGRCDTVAVVYGNACRSAGLRAYGGAGTPRDGYMNKWYYHPWGFSSPGAQYALAYQRYLYQFGKDESLLAAVPMALRKHAGLNGNAVMRKPLTADEYMNSRYVCKPFRIFDYCIVNDGGVCIILQRADMAADRPQPPILVAGVGRHSPYRRHTQMRFRTAEESRANIRSSVVQCLEAAELTRNDISAVQCYDGYSFQLPVLLEGAGFCEEGEGLNFIQNGRIELGGALPCNTSGGMLSESYMHGMNHQVEAVRQLRAQAGERQVSDAESVLYCHHGHWGALAILYRRG